MGLTRSHFYQRIAFLDKKDRLYLVEEALGTSTTDRMPGRKGQVALKPRQIREWAM
jgi:hypothetical protein